MTTERTCNTCDLDGNCGMSAQVNGCGGWRKKQVFNSPQAAPEAGSECMNLLSAKDLAIAALDNLANEHLKLGFTDYARSGKEYQKVIKGQIIIAKQILAKRGI